MKNHPYLRAYMAGIVVPTPLLLLILTFFCMARFVYHVPLAVERVIVFPMALVPNLWGAWNMLFLLLRSHQHLPIGLHGAILPLLLAPLGYAMTKALGFELPAYAPTVFSIALPIVLVIYYLVWKYLVRYLNELLGIA